MTAELDALGQWFDRGLSLASSRFVDSVQMGDTDALERLRCDLDATADALANRVSEFDRPSLRRKLRKITNAVADVAIDAAYGSHDDYQRFLFNSVVDAPRQQRVNV